MPILQLQLKPGVQSVSIPNEIKNAQFKLKGADFHFNVVSHGFYQARVYMDFLPPNNVSNNINFNRSIILSPHHEADYTHMEMDFNLGTFSIPRASIISVDLDSGHQIVPISSTVKGQPYSFKPDPQNILVEYDYVNTEVNDAGVSNYDEGQYVSLGVNAGRAVDQSKNSGIVDVNGQIQGPVPFLYSLVLTLEYDDTFF